MYFFVLGSRGSFENLPREPTPVLSHMHASVVMHVAVRYLECHPKLGLLSLHSLLLIAQHFEQGGSAVVSLFRGGMHAEVTCGRRASARGASMF
jgi:hypothetical protein